MRVVAVLKSTAIGTFIAHDSLSALSISSVPCALPGRPRFLCVCSCLFAQAERSRSALNFLVCQFTPNKITWIFGSDSPAYFDFAARLFRIFYMLIFLNGLQSSVGGFFSKPSAVERLTRDKAASNQN